MIKPKFLLATTLLSTAISTLGVSDNAKAIVFNFGNNAGSGNDNTSLTFEQSGLVVTATATSTVGGSPMEAPAFVTQTSGGLGVNSDLGAFDEDDPLQVDGSAFVFGETLSLAFGTNRNENVVLNSATFSSVDGDDQFTLLANGNTLTTDESIPIDGLFSFSSFRRADRTASIFTFKTTDNSDNYFLSSVDVDVVPEPFTVLGTLMAGAWGLKFRNRRNKAKQDTPS